MRKQLKERKKISLTLTSPLQIIEKMVLLTEREKQKNLVGGWFGKDDV